METMLYAPPLEVNKRDARMPIDLALYKKWSSEMKMYVEMLSDTVAATLAEGENILSNTDDLADGVTPGVLCELALRKIDDRLADIQGCFIKVKASFGY
jgi:hypothetical protein